MNSLDSKEMEGRAGAQASRLAPGLLSRWLWLFFGFVCIWAFMFVIVPAFSDLPMVKPIIDFNVKHDIKATALFYSDTEETGEAQNYLKNSKGFFR
jgi:hypothetical protein